MNDKIKTAGDAGTSRATDTKKSSLRLVHSTQLADSVQGFRTAIINAGVTPPAEIIADGKIHRFPTNGKRGDSAGWYLLRTDGTPNGIFGDWRAGIDRAWLSLRRHPTEADNEAMRKLAAARQAEIGARRANAAGAASTRWAAGVPLIGNGQPYLHRKGIQSYGLRLEGPNLLIPMRDVDGRLCGLQTISPDGVKRFQRGARVRGLYFSIGKIGDKIIICEGVATGLTLHERIGAAVAVAFCASNLIAVALALRGKFPNMELIVAADDDWKTPGNPGLSKAREAAAAVGARLAVPDFGNLPRGDHDTDFNDLRRLEIGDKGGAS